MTSQDLSNWLVEHPQVHVHWSDPLKGSGEHTGWFWFVKNNQMYADGITSKESMYKIFPYLVQLAKDTWDLIDKEELKNQIKTS